MNSSESGYNSGEDNQDASNVRQQLIQEPFLSTTSPNNMVPSSGGDQIMPSLDQHSNIHSSYRPPVQNHYQSETQVYLDDFHAQFTEQAEPKLNDRDHHKGGDDSNDEEVHRDELNKLQLFHHHSPKDAHGCTKIQTLKEYVMGIQSEQKNPKTNFFDLSREYYTGRYKGDNKRTIVVKSYLITEDYQNYVKDLSMDIIQTNQGCMPIIKTFEYNAYNKNKFVKALKFYNYKGDCKLKTQIIVDEGVMCDKFRTYDTSLLHFENSIIFYKREENWHKLQKYDVVTNVLEEITGYNIEEPIGEGIRYHAMFSSEFGKAKKQPKDAKTDLNKRSEKLEAFLSKHYVFCQSYCITEDIQYINKSLIGFTLQKTFQDQSQPYKNIHLPEIDSFKSRKQMDANALEYQVQFVGHIHEPGTGLVKFIAFDSFNSHHFTMNSHENKLSEYKTFYGNNETHMQKYHMQEILDQSTDEQTKHSSINCPFLKHQNVPFTIQNEKVTLSITEDNKEINQYFYMTNDNQFMLIYPNYDNKEQKNQVIFQLAQRHQYNPNPDIDYNYQDDYDVRKRDFLNAKYKKLSHICINQYRSMNYMKRARHIKDIVKYERYFNINDKIILSTDQQSNLIYIYQSNVITGENHIEIFNYENNIVNTKQATSLPKQIEWLEKWADDLYKEKFNRAILPPPHTTYYINTKYRRVVSTPNLIKTDMKTKQTINLDLLKNKDLAEDIRYKINQNPNCREQYKDLSFHVKDLQKDTFVIVENSKGLYMSLRIKLEHCTEKLRLQMYTKNKHSYSFFFTLTNEKDKQNVNQHFFAIKKTVKDVEELGLNNNDAIITMDKEITVFVNNEYNNKNEKGNLAAYTQTMPFKDLIELQKQPQPWLVKLGFEKCMDSRTLLDFVPLIYQERSNQESHHLIVFDVNKMQISRHYSLLSNISVRKHIRKTATGFGQYILTRTSDVYHQKQGMFLGHSCNGNQSNQIAKYQVGSQYYLTDVRLLSEQYDDQTQESRLNPANCTIEFHDFAIHFSCCGQNRIQLVGVKQMLVSESAQEERRLTFSDLFVIPWVDRSNVIKGCQFVLREYIEGDSFMQVIRMLDQEINTLFQHSSETIQYGHQKFLTSEDSHEDYILLISSQLRQRVYMDHFFDNSEAYWIHHKVMKKLLSQQLAKFEYFVLNDDFEALMREKFYQAQEVLQGKSINDLCLGFPREIAVGLKQPYSQYSSIKGSLIEEISNGEDEMMETYQKMELCEKNLLIQLDFNFCSSLRIAAELNANQSVKQLLTKIFVINDIQYQEIFMLEIPRLLQLPRIERFYDFLTRDYEEIKANEEENAIAMASDDRVIMGKHLNFEDVINHPGLPQFLSKEKNYHIKTRFKDFHNEKREIIDELVNLNEYDKMSVQSIKSVFVPKKFRRKQSLLDEDLSQSIQGSQDIKKKKEKKQENQESRNVEVEHSSINFTKVIIGEKIRSIQEHNYRQVNFNDNHLASIFYVEDEEYLDFYNLEAVRKIIDLQFVRTFGFLKFIMLFYVAGFLIPFVLSLSCTFAFFLNILYNICLFTQIWFIIFEGMQMKEQKLEYFYDFWNILDSSQFLLFFALYCIKMKNQFQTDSMLEIFISSFLLFQSFYKMIYFLRIFEGFNNIYQISCLIVKDLLCLMLLSGMFILAFTKQYTVMHNGINDVDGEYASIDSTFLKLIIQTYKSTRGDFATPTLDTSMTTRTEDNFLYRDILLAMNLMVSLLQEATFVVLGAVFFAQIIQFYEKYTPQLPTYMYKTMAKFNNECYDIVDMFVPQRNFKVVCFAIKKGYTRNFGYQGFTQSIQQKNKDNEDKLRHLREKDCNIHQIRHKRLLSTKLTVSMMADKVQTIETLLKGNGSRCNCQRL